MFLRDFPELNRLTDGFESSPRMVAWALVDALNDFNTTPPLIPGYGFNNFPADSVLIRGAAITLLQSVAILKMRNQVSYSDGGITVGKWDNAGMMMSFVQFLQATYEEKKKQLKVALNLKRALGRSGGVASELRHVNSWYGSF